MSILAYVCALQWSSSFENYKIDLVDGGDNIHVAVADSNGGRVPHPCEQPGSGYSESPIDRRTHRREAPSKKPIWSTGDNSRQTHCAKDKC